MAQLLLQNLDSLGQFFHGSNERIELRSTDGHIIASGKVAACCHYRVFAKIGQSTFDFQRSLNGYIDVEFVLEAPAGTARVHLKAGEFELGDAKQAGNQWKFTRSFSSLGRRRIAAVAFNAQGIEIGNGFMDLRIGIAEASADVRKKMVAAAKAQLGRDQVAHKEVSDYTGIPMGVDWCVGFCDFVYNKATKKDPQWGISKLQGGTSNESGRNEGWVPDMAEWAKQTGMWVREKDPHQLDASGNPFPTDGPKEGDLIVYADLQFEALSMFYCHIGVVTGVSADSVTTAEGNAGEFDVFQSHVLQRNPSRRTMPDRNNPKSRFIAGYVRLPAPQ